MGEGSAQEKVPPDNLVEAHITLAIGGSSLSRSFMGYQTGDMVKMVIPKGKYTGVYEGRVAIRFRPSFRLGKIDVHPQHLHLLQRCDGYSYEKGAVALPPTA